jgi:hypothetical protein
MSLRDNKAVFYYAGGVALCVSGFRPAECLRAKICPLIYQSVVHLRSGLETRDGCLSVVPANGCLAAWTDLL